MGKLVNFLEDLKDEYKERRDEENIWDELHRLREAVEMESKAIKVMAKYLDRKEKGEEEICMKELEREVEREVDMEMTR